MLQATIGRLPKSAAADEAGFANPPKNFKVRNAINIIELEMAKIMEVDFNHIVVGLQDAIEMARMLGEPATMISGYREQGKLAGLYVDRKEIDITHRRVFQHEELLEMTDEEIEQLIDDADSIELIPNESGVYEAI